MSTALPVMETFYTLQGEGFYAGVPAWFIRLGGCDVGCVWCDVKESWDPDIHPRRMPADLADEALASGANVVVITGGEPTMYNLEELTAELKMRGLRTHLETAAVNPISGTWDWICISPKKFRFPLEQEMKKAQELKIIVFNKSDFEWAGKWAQYCNPHCVLLLQPEWDKREKVLPAVVEFIQKNPIWRLSLQTHKYLGLP
ncbi:MAG: radical SAM protein [Bacteroidetes bacterium]|nr:radical SAM protein [Bacteroidota bacterium]